MYSDRRGNGPKPPRTKPSGQPPPRELRQPAPVKTYVCMHVLLKIGCPRCETYFRGVPRCVTKCGRGSQLVKNNVTYFMDDPIGTLASPESEVRGHNMIFSSPPLPRIF